MEVGSILSVDGNQIHIREQLGEGTQGIVYKVEVGGQQYALKWYHSSQTEDSQRERLRDLAERGTPSDRFIWPIRFLEKGDRFGYLMNLCPPDFISVGNLLGTVVDTSFQALIRACLQLVTEFRALHTRGLCYGDVSYNNVFLNPKTGDIRVLDNDNVVVNGSDDAGVLGTPRFMAPEVVRGDEVPRKETDNFSLAVLIYYILLFEHPLHGRREYEIHAMDEPAMEFLYGEEPVFMFDPNDDSNPPVRGHHDTAVKYWNIYPSYLKKAFQKTFTTGIENPGERTSNRKWQDVLLRLHDNILYCPTCGASNFYDLRTVRSSNGEVGECWNDGARLQAPPRMKFEDEGRVIMLNHDSQIFDFHVDPSLSAQKHRFRFDNPILEVTKHPSKKIWGLKNISSREWRVHSTDDESKSIPPGRSVSMSSGLKIDFGRKTAVIRD